jgi:hypothetical protein
VPVWEREKVQTLLSSVAGADIAPGDIVETYVYRGQITVVKKETGAAEGVLRHLRGDRRITDEQSRQRALAE